MNEIIEKKQIPEYESELIRYYLNSINFNIDTLKNELLIEALKPQNLEIRNSLNSENQTLSLKNIEDYLFNTIDKTLRDSMGMVFTPTDIVDYIVENVITDYDSPKIIDPSCGSGVFLYRSIEYLKNKNPNLNISDLIENNIFGIDIVPDNIRRAKILLSLLAITYGENNSILKFNLYCDDSVKVNMKDIFDIEKFDYVIGNPPYVKIQNLKTSEKKYLKEHFNTMKTGNINLYFAFIELGINIMSENGTLGYIIPNHFLKQKSAENLRTFLLKDQYISQVIDFKGKKLFENIMTYSAILFLDKSKKTTFKYSVIEENEEVSFDTINNNLLIMDYKSTNKETINLLNNVGLDNINKIESFPNKLDISTGIATQKDDIYTISLDNCIENDEYFIFQENGNEIKIEKAITVNLIKGGTNIDYDLKTVKKKLKIIYPYHRFENGSVVTICENEFQSLYPYAYEYLNSKKEILATRNNGSPTVKIWYEYGRSQSLNRFNPKIIFPTNADKPKFLLFEDEALFSNGYAIYGFKQDLLHVNERMNFNILLKILNSCVMHYYIKNTSYMIDGGYYCYQKKYLQNFSIPQFSEDELNWLENTNDINQVDEFLVEKYGISI